jgi:hypothetical protein
MEETQREDKCKTETNVVSKSNRALLAAAWEVAADDAMSHLAS